jgi:transposase
MFHKQSKRSVKSTRRCGGFESSEKLPQRRPARDRTSLGLQKTGAKLDPRRLSGSQSEQSLGPPIPLPDAQQLRLRDRVARRRQLLEMRTQELNRSHQATLNEVSKSIKHHLAMLDKQIAKIEKQIAELIDSNSDWKNKTDIMESVKGIGIDTARALLAELPEIGTLSKRQVASLAGLAPHAFESGQFKGKSSIWGGRAQVRCTLYMGTMAATVHNPAIKAFYDRLLAKGKLPMVALTACMRKLLTILNAMVRDGVSWNPEMAVVQA